MLPLEISEPHEPARVPGARLSEADAIDIWHARWLHQRRKDIVARYGCDPRRIYEIWEGRRFPAAREKALKLFEERYPGLVDHVDFSLHRRIARDADRDHQLDLF